MWSRFLEANGEQLVVTLLIVFAAYIAVILYVRLTGLRSFSKMSASDFAMTVAVGSVLASAAGPDSKLPVILVGLAALFGGQWLFAAARTRSEASQRLLDNRPVVVMAGDRILEENLRQARMTRDDLMAKLREANVLRLEQVRAVVFETTGDVSVLHSDDPEASLDAQLFENVRDADRHLAELWSS